MKKTNAVAALTAAAVLGTAGVARAVPEVSDVILTQRAERAKLAAKPRRLIMNNDGGDVLDFPKGMAPTEQNFLGRRMMPMAGKQAGAISYCTVSAGFSFFSHNTKVGEVLTRQGEDYYGYPTNRVNITGDLISQGTDTLKVATGFAHANGMECFWSMRMNDTHDANHRPAKPHPLFPHLKEAHPEWLVGNCVKRTPFGRWSSVDYGRAEIRELAFRYIEEVCRNYDVDGIELDFFRHLCYFSSVANGGRAKPEEVNDMTALMRRVRAMTEKVGLERHRPFLILMRLPDSVEFCRDLGLDLKTWLEEGLLDILVTTGYFQLNPWDYSVALGHRYGVRVYPSLDEPRVLGETRFKRNSASGYRGRAAQVWAAQADGLYLFNLSGRSPLWNELGDPKKLAFMEKVYFVTDRDGYPSSWLANGVKYRNMPIITPGKPVTLKNEKDFITCIALAEDPEAVDKAGLELEIKLHLELPDLEDVRRISLVFNGDVLPNGTPHDGWLDWSLKPGQLRKGENRISVGLRSARAPQMLKDVVISVAYRPKL